MHRAPYGQAICLMDIMRLRLFCNSTARVLRAGEDLYIDVTGIYRQGRSDGGYIRYIYPPKISPSKLLWGNNHVRTVIEHEY